MQTYKSFNNAEEVVSVPLQNSYLYGLLPNHKLLRLAICHLLFYLSLNGS